jgi:hypothetical protein
VFIIANHTSMNRKKKKWTTKNTHLERKKKRIVDKYRNTPYTIVLAIIGVATAIIVIISIALNNHVVGYDHFIGIPREWVHSLFK